MNGADQVSRPAMMDLAEAARAVGGTARGEARFTGVTTDSRAVNAGDLFVALSGERFDGHAYVAEAARRGAVAAMVARRVEGDSPIPQVAVDDTRLALGRLAGHWRGRFALPLAALTGSNGKTTVKEMLAAILASHSGSPQAVLATRGNLNNDIGMPLTLLELRETHRFAVIEMGMNHEGEIDYLTRIARPAVALVNNAQRAHVGILGSVEAIARAKGEIYSGLSPAGIAVVNADDAHAGYWRSLNAGRRVVSFGLSGGADASAVRTNGAWRFTTPAGSFTVALQVRGEHNVRNALAACAAAFALGVATDSMQAGLASFGGVPGRLERRVAPTGAVVIDDTYNANPESMKAALGVLSEEPGRKVFVMGDMGELGAESPALHAEVGEYARAAGIDALMATGQASRQAVQAFGKGATHHDDVESLARAAARESQRGATILVKGSRFMRMERVSEALAAREPGHAV
ncbi:MAG TPA: UDP-N-acetylmuramoyl-tripeptide--D-alanyl-D-alanine ligase [Usitatibacter sp.]|jgi:UDP-N-acetylmuramoyl-tripeptide--D-alanyl-D-alanine ligase|nr:UDP-N-acetylmuramoyl-tripeptide--D-alanyl-D-alanine ligase [Usitatibacter sp.]